MGFGPGLNGTRICFHQGRPSWLVFWPFRAPEAKRPWGTFCFWCCGGPLGGLVGASWGSLGGLLGGLSGKGELRPSWNPLGALLGPSWTPLNK